MDTTPNPFVYSDVFGGASIYPSDITYAKIALNQNITYSWPLESAPGINDLLPRLLEVTCTSYQSKTAPSVGTITANAALGATTLTIGNNSAIVPGALVTFDNSSAAPVFYLIQSVVNNAGVLTVTLASPLLSAAALGATLYHLILVPWVITMPDATRAGLGQTTLFVSTQSTALFNVVSNASSNLLLSIIPATAWQIYLTNNLTTDGLWSSFQYGAAIGAYQAAALAGPGLTAYNNALATAYPITTLLPTISSYTVATSDRATTFIWTAGSGTITLPDAALVGNSWYVNLRNQSTGVLTVVSANNADSINGIGFLALNPNDAVTIISDGNLDFYTLGLGQGVTSTFDYVVIDLVNPTTHVSPATLDLNTNPQYQNRIAYKFIGVLTQDITIIFPQYFQQYWVNNATTNSTGGASIYTMMLKTNYTGDAGLFIGVNNSAIYYSNGQMMVLAQDSTMPIPLPISEGGTGATNASQAIINLGGVSENSVLSLIIALS